VPLHASSFFDFEVLVKVWGPGHPLEKAIEQTLAWFRSTVPS